MASEAINRIIELMQSQPVRTDATIQEQRRDMENFFVPSQLPENTQVESVNADGVPAEWLATSGADISRVLLYLHGGGYVMGSINTHRALVAGLSAAAGARCLSLDYRLAPEYPFPAAVDDAVKGYRWLLRQNIAPGLIAIGGDSAGGGLTIATLVALKDAGIPLPCAAIALSPWVDLEGTGESMVTKADVDPMVEKEGLLGIAAVYLNGKDPRTPLASPLYADLRGLPPLLIQVGGAETLLDDSTRLVTQAKAVGVGVKLEVWDDMIHVFQMWASILPEGQQAINNIGAFLKKCWD